MIHIYFLGYICISSVLLENGFHDNPNEVEFLVTNQQLLAETIRLLGGNA